MSAKPILPPCQDREGIFQLMACLKEAKLLTVHADWRLFETNAGASCKPTLKYLSYLPMMDADLTLHKAYNIQHVLRKKRVDSHLACNAR